MVKHATVLLALAACQSKIDDTPPPGPKDARIAKPEPPPADASDLPVREPEPPDPGKLLADLGAVSAWQAVIDRAQYLAHRQQYGASISALIEEGFAVTAVDYAAALKHQSGFRAAATELLNDFNALLTPATVTPAPASLETTGDPAFNSPWSLAGLPTVSFPCGLSTHGMPCSLQLTGAWRGEAALLLAQGRVDGLHPRCGCVRRLRECGAAV